MRPNRSQRSSGCISGGCRLCRGMSPIGAKAASSACDAVKLHKATIAPIQVMPCLILRLSSPHLPQPYVGRSSASRSQQLSPGRRQGNCSRKNLWLCPLRRIGRRARRMGQLNRGQKTDASCITSGITRRNSTRILSELVSKDQTMSLRAGGAWISRREPRHTQRARGTNSLMMSGCGTFEICRLHRAMSEFESKAENICSH